MNKEPEVLTSDELLRIENIQLKRQMLSLQEEILTMDIAQARCLAKNEYGKTWMVQDGRILTLAPNEDQVAVDA